MEGRSAFKILTGTPTRNISLLKARSTWESNIREIGASTRNWIVRVG